MIRYSAFGVAHTVSKAYEQEQRVATPEEVQRHLAARIGSGWHPVKRRLANRQAKKDWVMIGDRHGADVWRGSPSTDADALGPDAKVTVLAPGTRGKYI
jgi:hypothetical protein